ncbi:MAG: glycoside hydrolase family 31 protein [Lachnospiraceae bacterium]|nr:hypothetical protein [Robinsoniella sp.]MDY3767757.1 glycoside hydrolase family 31 protein [Lachnospiraceae bacterium]
MKKRIFSALMALTVSFSMTSFAGAQELSQSVDVGEVTFSHVPYGIQQVYTIEVVDPVTAVRNPTTPIAGEETEIYVSAKLDSEEYMIRNVTMEWTLNGEKQPDLKMSLVDDVLSLPFAIPGFTADKADQVDLSKVDREIYTCNLPALDKDDVVTYHFRVGSSVSEDYEVTVMEDREYTQMTRKADAEGLILEADDGFQVQFIFGENKGIHLNTGFGTLLPDEILPEIIESANGLTAQLDNYRVEIDYNPLNIRFYNQDGEYVTAINGICAISDSAGNVEQIRYTLDSEEDEQYMGFGMQFADLDQRGNTVHIQTINWYLEQYKSGATYAPVPYYTVPGEYGLYIDESDQIAFQMASENDGIQIIDLVSSRQENQTDLHIFLGDNEQISEQYANVGGHAVMPPDWSFGTWLCANEWRSTAEIEDVMAKAAQYGIQYSAIITEGWKNNFYLFSDSTYEPHEGDYYFSVSDFIWGDRWTDPVALVEKIKENGGHFILWMVPSIKEPKLDENGNTTNPQMSADIEYLIENKMVIMNEDGTPYRQPNDWFTNNMILDFTNPMTKEWLKGKMGYLFTEIGISGFKTDGGEFLWGRDAVAFDGRRGDELRNAYPDLYAQTLYDIANELTDGDAVMFSRAAGRNMNQHPWMWMGDQKPTWEEFRAVLNAQLNLAISNVPFNTPDMSGFGGDLPGYEYKELYLRAMAQVAFSPAIQLHSEGRNSTNTALSRTRMPWNLAERYNDDTIIDIFKKFNDIHYELQEYIIENAQKASDTGYPMLRSMAYEYPDDLEARKAETQYMFGDKYLVCPVTEQGATTWDVYLPAGTWKHFFTGETYEGGQWYTVDAPLDEIPVFELEM